MHSNKKSRDLFIDICDAFFKGRKGFIIKHYGKDGLPKSGIDAKDCIPTYLVHHTIGEVVLADTQKHVFDEYLEREESFEELDIGMEDADRIRKIGVLYKPKSSNVLHANWIAVQEKGVIKPVGTGRDLEKDLKIIAKNLGISVKIGKVA